jgi:hypothetical protein
MSLDDFADREPPMLPERFFAGNLRGWGLETGPLGGIGRRIEVVAEGRYDPGSATLHLVETYRFDDGQSDRLEWQIRRLDGGGYEAREARATTPGEGRAAGAAFRLTYQRDVPRRDGGSTVLDFDDLFVQIDPDTVMVRAAITRLAVPVGGMTVIYRREPRSSAATEPSLRSAD